MLDVRLPCFFILPHAFCYRGQNPVYSRRCVRDSTTYLGEEEHESAAAYLDLGCTVGLSSLAFAYIEVAIGDGGNLTGRVILDG